MRPLRILHVAPYGPDAWAYGGIPRLAGTITRTLARHGHNVTFCTTDVCDRSARLPRPDGGTRRGSWTITTADHVTLRVFTNLSNRLAYDRQAFLPTGLAGYLRRHAGDFDVAHLHASRNLPGAIAAAHLKRAGVPYVLAPNGTAPRLERQFVAKRVYDALLGDRVLRGAAAVLAVSRAEVRQLEAIGVPASRIRAVPNPVDLDEFDEFDEFDAAPVRGRFRRDHAPGSGPLIVFLGKLTPRKRLDVVIDAFARLKTQDARLVIAGNDMGAGADARRQVQALGLASRTLFTGLLEGRRRLELLADADLVVYPSQDEIFGLVPLEALLAGAPVAVADDSGCGEVIREVGGGDIVPIGDVDGLAAAMRRAVTDPASARARVADAAREVRARFAPDVVCQQLEQVYAEAIAAHARRGFSRATREPVSFVVPVHNGAAHLADTVAAIRAQSDGRPMEIVLVDDGGNDGTPDVIRALADGEMVRSVAGPRRGAAAATNAGIRAARHAIICQVDQDVVLEPGWMQEVTAALGGPGIAAVQGRYVPDGRAGFFARVMAFDLDERYARLRGRSTTHVCTGNTAYRADALHAVGLFDESLGYGYDNDMSYRLRAAGYDLRLCRAARSVHHWREGLSGYLRQQYGFGYGRLDVVAKHPSRAGGDAVSPAPMMLHPIVMLAALASAAVAPRVAGLLLTALVLERFAAGVRSAWRNRTATPLWFPVVHAMRDLAWIAAIGVWTVRRFGLGGSRPEHSMHARRSSPDAPRLAARPRPTAPDARALCLIPAHNEAASLPAVIAEMRDAAPSFDVLVIDDGSTDGTWAAADDLGVRWMRFPERLGIGSAMRAGLRAGAHMGYSCIIRIDGDGQHRAGDIALLVDPIQRGAADVVLGSRYAPQATNRRGSAPLVHRTLGACLSALTRRRVTDPTSGFWAFGPRAIAVLGEHHPTGYPEPELRLFLSRNGLTTVEVPVGARRRLAGASSLTAGRLAAAGARVVLAMVVVPWRATVAGVSRD
jgi:glycosyltransferase involved in cell wall biosynthesis